MARISLGANFLGSAQQAAALNAAALMTMFNRPEGSIAPSPVFQVAGADVDNDGDEDKVAIQRMPLTNSEGKVVPASGTVDIEIEPLRMSRILDFCVDEDIAVKLLMTAFEVGQENQFPAKGAIPVSQFKPDATEKGIDTPWAGPGVPITFTLKNRTNADVTFYGSARVAAIVG